MIDIKFQEAKLRTKKKAVKKREASWATVSLFYSCKFATSETKSKAQARRSKPSPMV